MGTRFVLDGRRYQPTKKLLDFDVMAVAEWPSTSAPTIFA
jgi:hypothetical protein